MLFHRTPQKLRDADGEGGSDEGSQGRKRHEAAQLGSSVDVLIHELKQPLLCILVLGERLESMLKAASVDVFPKAVVARRDISALLVSVQQMRDVMSARSALANLSWVESEWSTRLNSQLEALDAVASSHGVAFSVNNALQEHDSGPDLSAVGQILSNLVTNAVHALEEANSERKEIHVEIGESDGVMEVSVHDSGEGVPQENVVKIFSKGFSTKQARGGSGYGLWVCRKLSEALGGSIVVKRSDRLGGACFMLTTPLARPEEESKLGSVA